MRTSYTPNQLQELLDNSESYADVIKKVGLIPMGRNYDTLKQLIKEYNLSTEKLNENRKQLFSRLAKIPKSKVTTESILNGEHPNYGSSQLLKRLVKEKYKEYKCEKCGISEWLGKRLSLQLHHKDGVHSNNHLDNLEILCPNCHSQTDNYCGRNLEKKRENKTNNSNKIKPRKKLPVNRQELKNLIRTTSFLQIGRKFGVTDSSIRKWCDRYELPRKKSIIKNISDEDWLSI